MTIGCRLTVAAMLLFAIAAGAQAIQRFQTLDSPREIPEFVLHDQDGERFDNEDLKGHWSLVSLGFTHCPDVCPTILSNLEAVRADLGLRIRPDNIPMIVFVAVDPERDSLLLKSYVSYFHPENIGVTGDAEQIRTLVEGMGGSYRIKRGASSGQQYEVQHSGFIYLISPAGKVVASLTPPLQPNATGEYLAGVIRHSSR